MLHGLTQKNGLFITPTHSSCRVDLFHLPPKCYPLTFLYLIVTVNWKTNNNSTQYKAALLPPSLFRAAVNLKAHDKKNKTRKQKKTVICRDSVAHLLRDDLYLSAFLIMVVCLTRLKKPLPAQIHGIVNKTLRHLTSSTVYTGTIFPI